MMDLGIYDTHDDEKVGIVLKVRGRIFIDQFNYL
jgi:hypothetical protein